MKYCKNCGQQLEDTISFCPSCGTSCAAPQPVSPQPAATAPKSKFSTWDGGVLETIGAGIVASLIITFTCGIATPWAICYMMKFIISHAVIDGKRLAFEGTGGGLFVNWLKWALLTLITCGIYSFWVTPQLYKWIASHIHTQD